MATVQPAVGRGSAGAEQRVDRGRAPLQAVATLRPCPGQRCGDVPAFATPRVELGEERPTRGGDFFRRVNRCSRRRVPSSPSGRCPEWPPAWRGALDLRGRGTGLVPPPK